MRDHRTTVVCSLCKTPFTIPPYRVKRGQHLCGAPCYRIWKRAENQESRFWTKVDVGDPDECWEWKGSRHVFGYGKFGKGHSHRFAYAFTHGEIPDGLWVLHDCDNASCCNPRHLHLGTAADNQHEAWDRGRHRRKIPTERLEEIRHRCAVGESTAELAVEFGVCRDTIRRIKRTP